MGKRKVIFITITRGLIARNILRSSFFQKLRSNDNVMLVILIPSHPDIETPQYLYKEIGNKNVKIEIVPNKKIKRFERLYNNFMIKAAFTKSTIIALKYHVKNAGKNLQLENSCKR